MLKLYRFLSPLLAALLPLGALFSAKLRATLTWRRECPPAAGLLRELARRSPRYWIHAASAGELEQARPLLSALRRRHPEGALLLSLASASARGSAAKVAEADLVLPLPTDTPRAMAALLEAYSPDSVLAVKWDLWPNLVLEAERRRIPVLLLGAVLGRDSGRARWPGRLLAGPLHARLAGVGAASASDAEAFRRLGVAEARLALTGDTRFDRVLARMAEGRPPALSGGREAGFCLVAGSCWPVEEEMLLDAFAVLRQEQPGMRLLLVPHEPVATHLSRLDASAARRDLPLWRLTARPELADGAVCVADRVGILPELYACGRLAMVGGGFGRGVHSVLEPAAQGLPVITGPRIGRADEARRLVAAGGAFIVEDGEALCALWRRFLREPAFLTAAAEAAAEFVRAESGAVSRSLAFLDRILAAESVAESP